MPERQSTHAIGFSRILGLRDSVALGMSLSVPLVLVVMTEAVFAAVGRTTPLAYLLAIPLYIPLILSYMELAGGRPGSASALQLAGSFKNFRVGLQCRVADAGRSGFGGSTARLGRGRAPWALAGPPVWD